MTENILEVKEREQKGKGPVKKLRRQGLIPAIMYGYKGNKPLSVHYSEFQKLFEDIGEHSIITLTIGGKEKIDVIVKSFQLDPVKRNIIHIDFLQIQEGQVLRTEIPVKVIGTSIGIKKGGILEEYVRDIEVECLPKDIPDSITIDVTDLDIGDTVHVRDLPVSDKLRILANQEQVVLAVGMPSKIEEPVVEEEEEVEEEEAAAVEGAEEEAAAAPEEKSE
jgi:large subunit ribosomal protein L25